MGEFRNEEPARLFALLSIGTADEVVKFLMATHVLRIDKMLFLEAFEPLRAAKPDLGARLVERLYALHAHIDAALGNPATAGRLRFPDLSFWSNVGDPAFRLRLLRRMSKENREHSTKYRAKWSAAVNRLTGAFISKYCSAEGHILWSTLPNTA